MQEPAHAPITAGIRSGLLGALKLLALSLIAIELAYVVLGNLFLGLGGLSRLASRSPETYAMEYASAWTLWPGRAWVRGLSMHAQDRSVQWTLGLERAELDVELGELFSRTFHATRIRGEGVVFRLRLRLSAEDADHPRARALPPVPGYADPPLRPIGPPEAPPTDEDFPLWTARLDDVDALVREIWIQGYRWTGDARIAGGFFFRPLRQLEVAPTRVELRGGELHVADDVALAGLEGRVEAALAALDPRDVGPDVLRVVTARAALSAQVPSLRFLRHHLDAPDLVIEDGSGALAIDASIDRGVLAPGSAATLQTARLVVRSPDVAAEIAAEARIRAAEDLGELEIRIGSAAIRRPDLRAPPALARGARLLVGLPRDLASPARLGAIDVDVPSLHVPDLRLLAPARSGGGPSIRRGSAWLRARFERAPGAAGRGRVGARLFGAAADWAGVAVEGDAVLGLDLEGIDPAEQEARVGGTLALRNVVVRHGEAAWPGWWAEVTLEEGSARAGEPLAARGRVRARCRDARPVAGVLAGLDVIPGWAPGMFPMPGVRVDAKLDLRGEALSFGIDARAPGESVRGLLAGRSGARRGAFLAKSGVLSAGVALGASGTDVTPLAGDAWLDEQLRALGARR